MQNTVNTSTHITKTPTQLSQHPHITKQVKTVTVQSMQNTVNTSTHITKTPTQLSQHPHITKQVKTVTVQDIHQMK